MYEIKFGLQVNNIMTYLTSSTWGAGGGEVWGGPHTPEIEIPKVALEWASPIQNHSLI